MKTLLAFLILTLPLYAVPDDGDPATGRARFSWRQEPAEPIVTRYVVTIWQEGQTAAEGRKVWLPSPPQVGAVVNVEVIEDGFVPGQSYRAYVQAAGALDEDISDPSEEVAFRYPVIPRRPGAPKVEVMRVELLSINESTNLEEWRTLAYIPAKQGDQLFVRLGKATAEEQ